MKSEGSPEMSIRRGYASRARWSMRCARSLVGLSTAHEDSNGMGTVSGLRESLDASLRDRHASVRVRATARSSTSGIRIGRAGADAGRIRAGTFTRLDRPA